MATLRSRIGAASSHRPARTLAAPQREQDLALDAGATAATMSAARVRYSGAFSCGPRSLYANAEPAQRLHLAHVFT